MFAPRNNSIVYFLKEIGTSEEYALVIESGKFESTILFTDGKTTTVSNRSLDSFRAEPETLLVLSLLNSERIKNIETVSRLENKIDRMGNQLDSICHHFNIPMLREL